jgi:hypothetical protein
MPAAKNSLLGHGVGQLQEQMTNTTTGSMKGNFIVIARNAKNCKKCVEATGSRSSRRPDTSAIHRVPVGSGPTQTTVQRVPGVRRLKREADNLPPPSSEVKNDLSFISTRVSLTEVFSYPNLDFSVPFPQL